MDNYSWLYNIPDGWYTIGAEMIKKCETVDPQYEITDMKEKWGGIAVMSKCNMDYYKAIYALEDHYERLSTRICCQCGQPATKISTGWILPWCDECGTDAEENYRRI